ncbi:hypothetical protein [Spiroplasma endosymbiont of Poecilobothrus nobilitatus]|uniref:hypothetical protein n=1 Tax=Spiroplasma endosymbiont of Poecilobothrus nobilitatus TaxID=1209220 RepID=UPI00313AA136
MKKLLSLLSVITISGTAVPTTIAASPYKKEETIKNSDINYQQTNNLEVLNRNKRSPQYNPVTGQGGGQQIYNPQTGGWGQPLSNPPWNFNMGMAFPTRDKTTKQLDGGMFDFGLNLGQRVHTYNPINSYQQPTYQQPTYQQPTYQQPLIQSTFNPNAPSTVNPGRTQGQDLEEFSSGMKKIERLANQQQRNY